MLRLLHIILAALCVVLSVARIKQGELIMLMSTYLATD